MISHPGPETVELRLMVELHGGHHAVRHPFTAYVTAPDVFDVRLVRAGTVGVDGALTRRIEERRPGVGDLVVRLLLCMSGHRDEQVGVGGGRRDATGCV